MANVQAIFGYFDDFSSQIWSSKHLLHIFDHRADFTGHLISWRISLEVSTNGRETLSFKDLPVGSGYSLDSWVSSCLRGPWVGVSVCTGAVEDD